MIVSRIAEGSKDGALAELLPWSKTAAGRQVVEHSIQLHNTTFPMYVAELEGMVIIESLLVVISSRQSLIHNGIVVGTSIWGSIR